MPSAKSLAVVVWVTAFAGSAVAAPTPTTEGPGRIAPRPPPNTLTTATPPAPPSPPPTVRPAPLPVATDYISRFTDNGALDPTFGTGSWYQTASATHQLAIDKSGRLYTFGTLGAPVNATIARVTSNGTADTSFTSWVSPIGATAGNSPRPRGLAIDPAGRVVAGVDAIATGGGMDPTVIRLLDTGLLDTSFGGTGKVVVRPPGAQYVTESRFVLDDKGRALVSGLYTPTGGAARMFVARVTENGRIDETFTRGGFAFIELGGRALTPARVLGDDQGRIYVVSNDLGGYLPGSGTFLRFANAYVVHRFSADGALDRTWGGERGGGSVEIALAGIWDGHTFRDPKTNALRVVLAGWSGGGVNNFYCVQLDETGARDRTFATNGEFKIQPSPSALASYVPRVLRTSTGQLILVGLGMDSGAYHVHVRRLSASGQLDTTYGNNGIAGGIKFGDPRTAVLDAQNRLVVRGAFSQ